MQNFAHLYLQNWRRVAASISGEAVDRAIQTLDEARQRDSVVWSAGNGGGSTLASHLSLGLTLNTRRAGGRPLRSTCLTADAAALSAAVNDFGADQAVRALLDCNARPGDVFCAITASGESRNLNEAVVSALERGVTVLALVGSASSTTARLANEKVVLGSTEPGLAEDAASAVIHAIYCGFMYEASAHLPSELANDR